jgi:hypothetical protein
MKIPLIQIFTRAPISFGKSKELHEPLIHNERAARAPYFIRKFQYEIFDKW